MHNNEPELPKVGPIIILLVNVIEDLIVAEDILILIIIDRATELESFGLLIQLDIMVL